MSLNEFGNIGTTPETSKVKETPHNIWMQSQIIEPLVTQTTNGYKEYGLSEVNSERQNNPLLFSSQALDPDAAAACENNIGWRAAFNELTTNASQAYHGAAAS